MTIKSFFIGGTIPTAAVGTVLQALYEAGATDMKCDPITSESRSDLLRKAIAKQKLDQLDRAGVSAPKAKGDITDTVLSIIQMAGQPVTVPQISREMSAVGLGGSSVNTPLAALVKAKKIKKVSRGTYVAA